MPLIRAIWDFVQRRMAVPGMSTPHSQTYRGDVYHDLGAGASVNWGGLLWIALVLVALPVIIFLVSVGIVYELVVRVDRRPRLPAAAHWVASLAIVLIGLSVFYVVALPSFRT